MDHIVVPWLALTLALAVFAILAIWARRPTYARQMALVAFVAAVPAGFAPLAVSLGWATPVIPGLTGIPGDFRVLGVKMMVGKGIFALLDTGDEPRYYRLPWDQKQADALQDMLDDPANEAVMMKLPPFEWSWDRHPPQFWPMPQPKMLPDKPPSAPAPRFDADRGREA